MAAAYITEYRAIGTPGPSGHQHQAPKEPALAQQIVNIAASSTQSSPFNTETRLIRVNVDAICSIAIGVSPTAVVTAQRLSAGQTEFFAVEPGHRIAVIQNV
ncbi:MAG: hypothetical protein SFV24_19185 [Gemmatimonadales bacterium]|nr:hypothetical protein [Gemmatimonadales bacterium]